VLSPLHLRTLIAVVRTGSFADAARRLGYTGSAVSQQIAALERAVKMPLFERDARSIRATPAAEILAARALQALASFDALQHDINEIAEGALGRIRLGSFPTASRAILPTALAAFSRDYPKVEIQLDEGEPEELIGLLEEGDVDVTLVYHYDLVPRRWPAELIRSPLLSESLILLLPSGHRLAGRSGLQLGDLADDTWISTREGTSGAVCLRRLCANAGFQPQIDFQSNNYAVIHAFVRSALGVALVPALGYEPGEGVAAVQLPDVTARRHVEALSRRGDSNKTVETIRDALRKGATAASEASVRLDPDLPHSVLAHEAAG